jgi:ribosome biogenesis GTPase / thiamine phosphate phosphatase
MAAPDSLIHGLVLWISDRRVRVWVGERAYELRLPGNWRPAAGETRPVAPGDKLQLVLEGTDLRIIGVLPRTNEFTRKSSGPKPTPQTAAANLDQVIVVASAASPAIPFGLVDRILVTAAIGGVKTHLLVNKLDLLDGSLIKRWICNYRNAVSEILFTSALSGEGLDRFENLLGGCTTLLAGASGVGKASLVNRLHPSLKLKTGDVSTITGKGKHITSSAILHPLPGGGWVIDTPGMRECAPWEMTTLGLAAAFPEIIPHAAECYYRNCSHIQESDCAVRAVVGSDELPRERYESYVKLWAEASLAEHKW